MIECRRGKGSVLIWTSDWNPQDAQWALSSRCVPFLAGCLEMTAGGRAPLLAAAPGEPLLLPEGTTGLRAADGTLFPRGEGRTVLDVPGVYAIEPGGGIVVVNVSGVESRLAPLPAEKFESLGVPVHKDAALGGVVPLQAARNSLVLVAAEIEARQGGWRWLLAAVLVLLGVETWWAARLPSREKGRML